MSPRHPSGSGCQAAHCFSIRDIAASQQDPVLLDALFHNCNYDFEQVSTILDPVLSAPAACQLTSLYLQGIVVQQSAFLVTNLNPRQVITVLPKSANWLLGRSSSCAVTIDHAEVSRCHAAIGFAYGQGFYLTDVGSDRGTWLNRHRLDALERRALKHGDLLEFGSLRIEFFISGDATQLRDMEETCC
ncbi:MAG: FHA domain-containing protein [Leptolyngbya sp. SIO4C5]|uniref:FHA domain-containing protein n=1 Tax=Sphaerothrix gracilis TaxID=3151835 RepID=UPI0013C1092A|nr:FHA domain-containing protein [Leptolyngbya sp. SIO4C5]